MSGGPEIDVPSGASAPGQPRPSVFDTPTSPVLPVGQATPAFDRNAEATPNTRPAASTNPTYYRSDQDRAKSVYRRANPWYRRLARSAVAVCILVVFGGVLYFGASALQDYLGRDRLPAVGATLPDLRTSTFLVKAGAPAPQIEGTLVIDEQTGAFTFTGDAVGPQADVLVASADGSTFVIRDASGTREVGRGEPLVADLVSILPYLTEVDGADDILTSRLRPYVTLADQTSEGVGTTALDRYEMEIDTEAFSTANPLLWASFEQEAVPGASEVGELPLTIWLDQDEVVVRLRASTANWSWERADYSDAPHDVSLEALAAGG